LSFFYFRSVGGACVFDFCRWHTAQNGSETATTPLSEINDNGLNDYASARFSSRQHTHRYNTHTHTHTKAGGKDSGFQDSGGRWFTVYPLAVFSFVAFLVAVAILGH